MNVARPMKSTIGRITSANSVKVSPKADACATSASATIAPESVERNIAARLNDSFQARDRDASRLQCSVARIWRRSEADGLAAGTWPGALAGSAPIAVPAVSLSKDIRTTSAGERVHAMSLSALSLARRIARTVDARSHRGDAVRTEIDIVTAVRRSGRSWEVGVP